MTDGVECGAEVKEDEDGEETIVGGAEDVIGDFKECGFGAME